MKNYLLTISITAGVLLMGCQSNLGTFTSDVKFLQQHTNTIVLEDLNSPARVAVAPAYQGRVMTSTVGGPKDPSFGWINRQVIEKGFLSKEQIKGTLQEHIYVFGGEDRFWIGPEGGQFSIYFDPGEPFDFEHWNTPPLIDTQPFDLIEQGRNFCKFKKNAALTNYSGTEFDIEIERIVRVLSGDEVSKRLNCDIPQNVRLVGYETVNSIKNTANTPWKKNTGLLSIWILGMFTHAPHTTVVIPFKQGPDEQLGPKVKDDYFGKVTADRLVVKENVLFFKADGKYRSKIGISPMRAKPYSGSYDRDSNVLTIVSYNQPETPADYVNSAWEIQQQPYKGDVVNSYNDGPAAPGKPPLGPFYELETSSPAVELKPNQKVEHIHTTIHIAGKPEQLNKISKKVLEVSLDQINKAFTK